MRHLATILSLKSKLSGKFQCFNAIYRCIEMLKNSWIFKDFYPQFLSPSHQIKPYYVSVTKIFLRRYKEIWNIQTFAFKVLQEFSSSASTNAAVQISFLTPKRNMFTRKFVKPERFLAVLRDHFIFNVNFNVKVCKMSEVFWAKLYCKMCGLFC